MSNKPLPASVLAALGLAMGTSCGPCLNYAPTKTETGTPDTGPEDDTGTEDTGAATDTQSAKASFERLAAEGVLPADVVERLRNR